jgi:hypothetical protein
MPTIGLGGQIPKRVGGSVDFGSKKTKKIDCSECEKGLSLVPSPARGVRKDYCEFCEGTGEI